MKNQEQEPLSLGLEVDITVAPVMMKVMKLLDGKSEDYRRGFSDGYDLSQKRTKVINKLFQREIKKLGV